MDYEHMSIEELEAENVRLSEEKALIRQEQLALTVVLNRKMALREAHIKFDALSEVERDMLAQVASVKTASIQGKAAKAGE